MLRLFFRSLAGYLRLTAGSFNPRAEAVRWPPRRLLLIALLLPLFLVLQLWHWLGLAVDEVLFGAYRRIDIRRPVFVLGPPRSGTTFVHRSLAEDRERFTTLATWEVLFAHSITARYLLLGLARLDRWCGRPLARLVGFLERRVFGRLADLHPMRLDEPEEDYLTLTPILACFILIVPFPFDRRLWQLARFDVALEPAERQRILRYYSACLKRHLYVFGKDRQLLSKNAAFASWIHSLADFFPDALFIRCDRPAIESVPSLLSATRDGIDLFGADRGALQARLIEMMEFYYRHLADAFASLPARRTAYVAHRELRERPEGVLLEAYRRLGFDPSRQFRERLRKIAERHQGYRSRHRYSLAEFGLSEQFFAERFGPRDAAPLRGNEAA